MHSQGRAFVARLGVIMFDTFWQDVRYAARSLRHTPGFTAAALVTLALGIGANTAIFSLVEAVMLRTLPIRAPQQLQFIAHGEGDDVSTSSNFGWYERVQQETGIFEGVAADIGVYGVTSFDVTRRTRDIGIRIALGASPRRVLSSVLRQTVAIAAAGIAVGLGAAAVASVVISRFLFGIEPRDPVTFALGGVILALTALVASYLPARRASRVDPMSALRAE